MWNNDLLALSEKDSMKDFNILTLLLPRDDIIIPSY